MLVEPACQQNLFIHLQAEEILELLHEDSLMAYKACVPSMNLYLGTCKLTESQYWELLIDINGYCLVEVTGSHRQRFVLLSSVLGHLSFAQMVGGHRTMYLQSFKF